MEVPVGEISEPFRLIYEAVRGRGNQGYIAIDNVTLHNCHKGRIDFLKYSYTVNF